jgi:hypothetical protein
MKVKIIFYGLFYYFFTGRCSQQSGAPQSVISTTAVIRKYHTQDELKVQKVN